MIVLRVTTLPVLISEYSACSKYQQMLTAERKMLRLIAEVEGVRVWRITCSCFLCPFCHVPILTNKALVIMPFFEVVNCLLTSLDLLM